ncbi:hypothetical protein VFPPC_05543 [Pochonia chlamydosporia 170]|uniref:Uncharacterized protein n=1 Tax=Pochonia chlamydosporia 170 TaxID=1380566 RepID=A0A179FFD4_METCM|nr:hypothetical protein VFPPC_05543 [Pochonia chlamydosporia 170]OAQ64234.1 hypothetical protein VFPPC_05543 [Pochonia chlamydosporia 170]
MTGLPDLTKFMGQGWVRITDMMKYYMALATLASVVCAQDTRLFSIPPQPTPNESSTGVLTILPVPSLSTGTPSGGTSGTVSGSQPSETVGPTTIGHITPDPTTSGVPTVTSGQTSASAPGTTTGSGTSGTQSGSGSSSGTGSPTSNPAAGPTAHGFVVGVVALAGLAVAI